MDDHIKSEISVFLAGGLMESRNRQIEAHAAECEKCRQALAKARGKLARQNREALKKASPEHMPNLFLARQGKIEGVDAPRTKTPWIFASVLLAAGVSYWLYRHYSAGSFAPEALAPVAGTVAVSGAPVANPAPAAVKAAETPPEARKFPVVLPVLQEWKGADSGIKEARLVVIRNRDALNALWTEMQEKELVPAVHFNRQVVVGVFAGERANGATIALGQIRELENDVSIPYHVSTADVAVSTTTAHPYLLSLIPRVEKKIRLTETEDLP